MVQNQLFILIKSMTKSEKGYFKKYSTRQVMAVKNNYVKLFDEIDKQEKYDEIKLIKRLKGESFIKHVAVLKGYLYKLILKSLRSYYEENTLGLQIKSRLAEVGILYERGLGDQAMQILHKAKSIASQNEKNLLLQEINDWERKLASSMLYKGLTSDQLSDLSKNRNILIQESERLNEYLRIQEKTFFADYHLKDEQKEIQIKEISAELDQLFETMNISQVSFQSSFLYYRIRAKHATILKTKNDPVNYKMNLLRLLESHPRAILDDPDSYIVTLFNILAGSEHLVDAKEQLNILNRISEFETENKKFLSFKNRVKIFSYLTIIRTHLFIETGNFKEGMEHINKQVIDQMKRYDEKINIYDKTIINFNIAYIFFGMKDYRAALRWINKIINVQSSEVIQDFYSSAKLLNLIIHYELKNIMTIPSLLRSTDRFFKTKNSLTGAISILMEGLKNIIIICEGNSKKESIAFKNLRDNLLEYQNENSEGSVLKDFDYISWLESKIEKKPFPGIVKDKALCQLTNKTNVFLR